MAEKQRFWRSNWKGKKLVIKTISGPKKWRKNKGSGAVTEKVKKLVIKQISGPKKWRKNKGSGAVTEKVKNVLKNFKPIKFLFCGFLGLEFLWFRIFDFRLDFAYLILNIWFWIFDFTYFITTVWFRVFDFRLNFAYVILNIWFCIFDYDFN